MNSEKAYEVCFLVYSWMQLLYLKEIKETTSVFQIYEEESNYKPLRVEEL